MIEAFRTIEIQVEMRDGSTSDILVPFTVELLHRVEETIQRAEGRTWFVLRRSDKSILEAFESFCKPFFPADFDFTQVQPTFCALFFSHVRTELVSSIDDCMNSTPSTKEPDGPTEERTKREEPSQQTPASS